MANNCNNNKTKRYEEKIYKANLKVLLTFEFAIYIFSKAADKPKKKLVINIIPPKLYFTFDSKFLRKLLVCTRRELGILGASVFTTIINTRSRAPDEGSRQSRAECFVGTLFLWTGISQGIFLGTILLFVIIPVL